MRKDVKLGFAIGGVLLAVVIVFALVNSRPKVTNEPSEDPNTVAQADGTDTTKSEANKSADVKSADTKSADTKTTDTKTAANTQGTDAGKTAVASGDTKAGGDTMFKNSSSTDWEKTLNTGSPVLAANQPVKLTGTPVTHTTKTTGVSTPTDSGAGSVTTGATGFSYVSSSQTPTRSAVTATGGQHPQNPDSDELVRGAGTTNDRSVVDLNKTKTTAGQSTSYTIKNGDTFSIIANAHYGAAKYYKLILAANPKVDPSHLKIGTVITLPALDAKADTVNSTPAASPEKPINATTQYRVQSGDNLHRICLKLYGDAKQVDALYDANKAAIGSDPAKLKLGMILTLPTAPTAKS